MGNKISYTLNEIDNLIPNDIEEVKKPDLKMPEISFQMNYSFASFFCQYILDPELLKKASVCKLYDFSLRGCDKFNFDESCNLSISEIEKNWEDEFKYIDKNIDDRFNVIYKNYNTLFIVSKSYDKKEFFEKVKKLILDHQNHTRYVNYLRHKKLLEIKKFILRNAKPNETMLKIFGNKKNNFAKFLEKNIPSSDFGNKFFYKQIKNFLLYKEYLKNINILNNPKEFIIFFTKNTGMIGIHRRKKILHTRYSYKKDTQVSYYMYDYYSDTFESLVFIDIIINILKNKN